MHLSVVVTRCRIKHAIRVLNDGSDRRQFYAHHLAAISHAIVAADAMTIHQTADALGVELVTPRGATPAGHAPGPVAPA